MESFSTRLWKRRLCPLPFAPDALFIDEEPRSFSRAIFTAEGLINNTGGADTLASYRSWNNNEEEGFVGGLMKCLHGGEGVGGAQSCHQGWHSFRWMFLEVSARDQLV